MPAPLVIGGILAAKGISSFMKGRGADQKAKAEASNQNAMNKWKHKFDTSNWGVEKKSYYRGRDRSRSMRNQLVAALMKNPKYGLSKLFPGFANFSQQWTGGQPAGTDLTPAQSTANPYDVAGAPPEMQAATAGTLGNIAAGIGGAADTAASMYTGGGSSGFGK